MGTTRRPKGTYTRPTSDFFSDRAAIGGIFYSAPNGFSAVVELYNNAQDGSSLHVYRIWAQTDAGGAFWITRQTGSQGGTQVPTYAIISSGGSLPGIINYAQAPIVDWNIPTAFVMPAYIGGDNEAGSMNSYAAPGPICILVPGDSIRIFSPSIGAGSSGVIGCGFYWLAMRDLG